MYEIFCQQQPKKLMIFGRPVSGKSTFAVWLSHLLNLPLHHLDKHFFQENWVERNYEDFLKIQQNIVDVHSWIIDGNSIRSLEVRWQKADLVLYFNFNKFICFYRLLRRFCKPNKLIDDRAPGCHEVIRWSLIKYLWNFEERVAKDIVILKALYPNAIFTEIKNSHDLDNLKIKLQSYTTII